MPTNEFDINVAVNEEGAEQAAVRIENAISNMQSKISDSLQTAGSAVNRYVQDLDRSIKGLSSIATGINPAIIKQLNDPKVGDEIKKVIMRQMAQAAAKDLTVTSGGTDATGRAGSASASGRLNDLNNTVESLSARLATGIEGIFSRMQKSIESAQVMDFARQRGSSVSSDPATAALQVKAQGVRAGLAANEKEGGTVASQYGISGLGTATQELEVQKQMAAASKQQLADQKALTAETERTGQANARITAAQASGNDFAALNMRIKQEQQRLEQIIFTEEEKVSGEYEHQIDLVQQLVKQRQEMLNAAKQQAAQDAQDSKLQRSKEFATGTSTGNEIAKNNIIGSRRTAQDPDVQASLLALQTGLSVNYALIGAISGAVTSSISQVVEYDDKLHELAAIAGSTNIEFGRLRDGITQVSEASRLSAVELTEGAIALAQAGLKGSQILQILPDIANAALATGTTFKEMAELLTGALNVFNIDYSQSRQVLDTFSAALIRSRLSIGQLGTAFQYSSNIAADLGITYQELATTIAGIGQAGISSGSMIGTGLRQVFTALANPTDKLKTLLDQLGLSLSDVDVRTQGVTGVLLNLKDAGLTAEQALATFDRRTVTTLVAAVNQAGYMQTLQRSILLNSAAEDAAAKAKESLAASSDILKNALLAIINQAAQPYVAVLTRMAGALEGVGEAASILAPVITVLMALLGGIAVTSVISLVAAFLRFSNILNVTAISSGELSSIMAVTTEAMVASTSVAEGASAAWSGFGLALEALEINPIVLAVSALILGVTALSAVTDGATGAMGHLQTQIDQTKTSVNDHTTAAQSYNTIATQINDTIQRLVDRHQQLTQGNDNTKNATQELSNETLSAAITFNKYGASIDATGESLTGLIAKLQSARDNVVRLQQAESAAALTKLKQEQGEENSAAQTGANSLGGSNYIVSAGLGGGLAKQYEQIRSQLQATQKSGQSDSDFQNQQIKAGLAASNFASVLEKAAGGMDKVTKFFNGGPLDKMIKGLEDTAAHATKAASLSGDITSTQRTTDALGAQTDPNFRRQVERVTGIPYNSVDLNNSASFYKTQLKQNDDAYRNSGETAAQHEQRQNDILTKLAGSYDKVKAAADALDKYANTTGNRGYGDAATGRAQALREGAQSVAEVGRTLATKLDDQQSKVLASAESAYKSGNKSGAFALARTVNINVSDEASLEKALRFAQAGGNASRFNGLQDAGALNIQNAQGVADDAAANKRNAAAGRAAESAAFRAAKQNFGLTNNTAAEDMKIGNATISTAEQGLNDAAKTGITPDVLQAKINAAQVGFDKGQKEVADAFDKQIAAQDKFNNFLKGDDKTQGIEKSAALATAKAQALAANETKFQDDVSKALDKIPSVAHPFKTLVDAITRNLAILKAKLDSESNQVNQLNATSNIFGTIGDRAAREGRTSSALVDAQKGAYAKQIDSANDALLPQQLQNLQAQQGVYSSALDARNLKNGAGTVTSASDIARGAIAAGGSDQYIEQQSSLIGTLGSVQQNEAQKKYVADLKTQLPAVISDYQKLNDVTNQVKATQSALDKQTELANMSWGQQLNLIVQHYMQTSGMQNTWMQDLQNEVPQVLGEVQSSFKSFFADISTGTKSIGQSFKDLATGILNSFMQVVESEAAKALLKLILQIGESAFGFSTGGVIPTDHSATVAQAVGGAVRLASGGGYDSFQALKGSVTGGIPGRDSVNTELEPGEFVMRKSAVDAIGEKNLAQMNTNGNRAISSNPVPALSTQPTTQINTPFEIYMVSPDKTPPTSKQTIVMAIQDDMVNKGAVYKSVKAAVNGQI